MLHRLVHRWLESEGSFRLAPWAGWRLAPHWLVSLPCGWSVPRSATWKETGGSGCWLSVLIPLEHGGWCGEALRSKAEATREGREMVAALARCAAEGRLVFSRLPFTAAWLWVVKSYRFGCSVQVLFTKKCSILAFINYASKSSFLKGGGVAVLESGRRYKPNKPSASCHLMDAWVWVGLHFQIPFCFAAPI